MEEFWVNLEKSGLFSILVGVVVPLVGAAAVFLFARWRRGKSNGMTQDAVSYPEGVKELSSELARASSDVEHVLEEMAIVSRSRNEAFANLEQRVRDLAQHEKDLQTRVETLKNISLPAAEYFLQATARPKPAPNRSYLFFGLGALVSAVITLVVKFVFNL